MVKNPPADAGDTGSIPGLGRPLEKEMATHSSTLPGEFHGGWWATVHGVAKSRTGLHFHFHFLMVFSIYISESLV